MRPNVTLIANSGKHQRGLPEALARVGVLSQAVRSIPDFDLLEPGPDGDLQLIRRYSSQRITSRILWAIRRRLPVSLRGAVPMMLSTRFADRRISTWLRPCDVFHGLMGGSVLSLQRARQLGAKTLIDNPTLHPAAFRREVLADYDDAGVRLRDADPVMGPSAIRRCEGQYEQCDKIITYSSAADRSFHPYGYAAKAVIVHPGVDHESFSPALKARRDGIFRVCYVGRIEAPKGMHHLVQAWKRLALPNAELVLAGSVFAEMAGLHKEGAAAGIRLTGILTAEEVARCCRESDLFVFPSVNEGLSLALLEAMSCGLPVVACHDTGAEDCVTPGREGLLVRGRNTHELADSIQWCYGHREELAVMGSAARRRVESEFTLGHYVQRLMELYRSVTEAHNI